MAQEANDTKGFRKGNWSHPETVALLQAILPRKGTIFGTLTPNLTPRMKAAAWVEVAAAVATHGVSYYKRTVKEVKEKFNGLKKKFRKAQFCRKQMGRGMVPPTPYDSMIEEIIGKLPVLIDGSKDRDAGEILKAINDVDDSTAHPSDSDTMITLDMECHKMMDEETYAIGPAPDTLDCNADVSINLSSHAADPMPAEGLVFNLPQTAEVVSSNGMCSSIEHAAPPPSTVRATGGSSASKKRRAALEMMNLSKSSRRNENWENPVSKFQKMEYYQMLIEGEKQSQQNAAERESLAIEKERLAVERERHLIEMAKTVTEAAKNAKAFFSLSTEVAELQKQKLEAELKELREEK